MTYDDIQAALQEALKERSERTEITQDYVLEGLRDVFEVCRQRIPILDADGNPTGYERAQNPAGANRAGELLGKHMALFTDRVEHRGGEPLIVELVKFADDASS